MITCLPKTPVSLFPDCFHCLFASAVCIDSKGFPHTLTCSLSNTSLVSMSFDLRIPGDGIGRDSVTSIEQVTELDRNDWKPGDRTSERPQEFRVTPSSGTIRAQSQMDIKVRLFVLIDPPLTLRCMLFLQI